jgi:hypothetical protein
VGSKERISRRVTRTRLVGPATPEVQGSRPTNKAQSVPSGQYHTCQDVDMHTCSWPARAA